MRSVESSPGDPRRPSGETRGFLALALRDGRGEPLCPLVAFKKPSGNGRPLPRSSEPLVSEKAPAGGTGGPARGVGENPCFHPPKIINDTQWHYRSLWHQ